MAPANIERPDLATLNVEKTRSDLAFDLDVPFATPLDLQQLEVRAIGCEEKLPLATGATRLEGVVDFSPGSAIGGWAWRVGYPTERVHLLVKYEGETLATLVADRFREDLLMAGIGDGNHAFSYELPQIDFEQKEVEIVFEDTGAALVDLIHNAPSAPQFGNRVKVRKRKERSVARTPRAGAEALPITNQEPSSEG
jgi:hypothetical protein